MFVLNERQEPWSKSEPGSLLTLSVPMTITHSVLLIYNQVNIRVDILKCLFHKLNLWYDTVYVQFVLEMITKWQIHWFIW